MNARIRRIPFRMLSVAFLSVAVLAVGAIEARAACFAPGASKLSTLTGAAKLARPGTAPALAAAAQGAGSSGGGPIVGLWQVLMTAFPGTNNEFIFDFAFQQFHADGTEMMISGGVPPSIGNICIGAWERRAGGVIRLRHMTWNFVGGEVLGDLPTGYFLLDVTLRPNSQGTAYEGTWKAASYDLGAGPLGSGGPPQPNSEYEGTLQAVRVTVP
jgi:hypothetical protein